MSTSTATYRGRHERDGEARGPEAVRTPDHASIAADQARPVDRGDRGDQRDLGDHGNRGDRGDQSGPPDEPGEAGQSGQVDLGEQGGGATSPGADRPDHQTDGDTGEVAADLGTRLDDGARVVLEGEPSGA